MVCDEVILRNHGREWPGQLNHYRISDLQMTKDGKFQSAQVYSKVHSESEWKWSPKYVEGLEELFSIFKNNYDPLEYNKCTVDIVIDGRTQFQWPYV